MTEPAEQPAAVPTLHDLRQRVLRGEPLNVDEYAQVIQSLRARRTGDISAAADRATAKPSRASGGVKQAATVKSAAALDDLLKGLLP